MATRKIRPRGKTPPTPPKRGRRTTTKTDRAHIRRVTLNLIRHALCCPRPLRRVLNKLAKFEWDMDALPAKALDTIYAYVDEELAEKAKAEFTADTSSIVDHRASDWTCELCGHQNCRWEFTLENVAGGQSVKTGSHCIVEYSLSVDGEVSAEEALKRLRAAISRMKRVEECEKWQQAHPDHVEIMDRLKTVYDYVRAPISVRTLWNYLKRGWNSRTNPWQKKAKATLKYYNREGFLTAKRTDDLSGLIAMGEAFYSERSAAQEIVDSFAHYWNTLITEWTGPCSSYELDTLIYARRWLMDPDRPSYQVSNVVRVLERRTGGNPARDEDGNAILSGSKAKPKSTTTSGPPRRRSERRRRRRKSKARKARPAAPTSTNPVNDDLPF